MQHSIVPDKSSVPLLLDCSNVSVLRDGKQVLKSISIKIPDGKHVAILGPNGSGKSSFIKLLMRELYPAQCDSPFEFKIYGRENWNVFELRTYFGLVSNDLQFTFTRRISGREVLLSGFFSSIGLFYHQITQNMEDRAWEIAKFLNIEPLMDQYIEDLSSGEARRLLIGRALIHRPKVLILDEPTSSLDLHALHTLRSYLREIARSGIGIILITHQIHDIIPEIDRVIMMKNGRFVLDDAKEEILTSENMKNLFGIPIRIKKEDGYFYATGY
ncbi:MAG: ATP-binding cassette domain-containing protein [Methanospirillum sp.]|uniref:ABC transporter ATP-binding protein n=1 Tax=Methanospirillum sp. TaxID=45200 RepID=UPI00236EF7EB|nr:ATP-binding cassette domain-containing protein [Methanospirillum sp.]MDD1728665.1 ATP-binding cassette domain-containing protein [Methanospirillum sp.]